MNITIRNHRALRFFGFHPVGASARVSQPAGLWVKCLWWRITGPQSQ